MLREFATSRIDQLPTQPHLQPNGSINEAPTLSPTQTQPMQVGSTVETGASSASHTAMLNGNGKPILRHGLVDERILDTNGLKPPALEESAEPIGIEQNGLELENELREPAPLGDPDLYSSTGVPRPHYGTSEQPHNQYTAQPMMATVSGISSGQRRFEAPAVGRKLTNLERRLTGFLGQLWRIKM
jgi:hypothetical protein